MEPQDEEASLAEKRHLDLCVPFHLVLHVDYVHRRELICTFTAISCTY